MDRLHVVDCVFHPARCFPAVPGGLIRLLLVLLLPVPVFGQGGDTCSGGGTPPTPTEVAVTAVPVEVTSTTDDYFVLYATFDVDGTEIRQPLLVKRGEEGTTTLSENVPALPADRYRVEKYAVSDSADVDGDCIDDLTELDNLGSMSPVSPAAAIEFTDGALAINDHSEFELLSATFTGRQLIKGIMYVLENDLPRFYFANTNSHRTHERFRNAVDLTALRQVRFSIEHQTSSANESDDNPGRYYVKVEYNDLPGYARDRHQRDGIFGLTERIFAVLAASMRLIDDNLSLHIGNDVLDLVQIGLPQYRASRMPLVFDADVYPETFVAVNPGTGFGRLQVREPGERPRPRDVVIYEALPK